MMIMIGIFQVIAGLVAIFDDDFYVVTQNYTFDLDISALGLDPPDPRDPAARRGVRACSRGATWARRVAIVLAVLTAIENFFFIPYYPFWSILVIALCVWVIWALTRPGAIRAAGESDGASLRGAAMRPPGGLPTAAPSRRAGAPPA